jgi:predicted membrane chloride channel (bestrophin family)
MTLPSHEIMSDSMLAGINVFTDTLAHLERILTTPIPFSYQAHIYEVSWLYCLLLVSYGLFQDLNRTNLLPFVAGRSSQAIPDLSSLPLDDNTSHCCPYEEAPVQNW